MEYSITASSVAKHDAVLAVKQAQIEFGTTDESANRLPNPAELFLGAFAACMLKNVERFSTLLHFTYERARVQVQAVRLERPPRMDELRYSLTIYSKDPDLRIPLLKKNLERYGTIFNTVKQACSVRGEIEKVTDYV
ncbi:MAG: OsmC family peroxiredoxin [Bacteroidetes bacterium]|nr:MAG: OsmC family peroxiredoxin [Bacteroidota bacterium]